MDPKKALIYCETENVFKTIRTLTNYKRMRISWQTLYEKVLKNRALERGYFYAPSPYFLDSKTAHLFHSNRLGGTRQINTCAAVDCVHDLLTLKHINEPQTNCAIILLLGELYTEPMITRAIKYRYKVEVWICSNYYPQYLKRFAETSPYVTVHFLDDLLDSILQK